MICIFISIFGHLIVIRTLNFLISTQIISTSTKIILNIYSFLIVLTVYFAFSDLILVQWLIYLFIFLLPFAVLYWQESNRRQKFSTNLLSILDNVIIQMRSGKSVKMAVQDTAGHYHHSLKYYLLEISSALQFETITRKHIKDSLLRETVQELVQISHSSHKQLDRMKAYRRKIKIQEDFRRKSGQVGLQTKAQAGVLGIIFLGLLVFTLATHGFRGNEKIILIALVLYSSGAICLLRIGKRYKWKV